MTTTAPLRILLVEDQVELAELLRDYLLKEDYEVEVRHSGHRVIERVRESAPDMLLLDLMLPGTDGMTICRSVRRFSDVPIIMVTARTEEIDRLLGLEIGADDYICKPVRPREVVARVKAVLRRTHRQPGEVVPDKSLTIDEARYAASYDGHPWSSPPWSSACCNDLRTCPAACTRASNFCRQSMTTSASSATAPSTPTSRIFARSWPPWYRARRTRSAPFTGWVTSWSFPDEESWALIFPSHFAFSLDVKRGSAPAGRLHGKVACEGIYRRPGVESTPI